MLFRHPPLRFSIVGRHPNGGDGVDAPAFLLVQVPERIGNLVVVVVVGIGVDVDVVVVVVAIMQRRATARFPPLLRTYVTYRTGCDPRLRSY